MSCFNVTYPNLEIPHLQNSLLRENVSWALPAWCLHGHIFTSQIHEPASTMLFCPFITLHKLPAYFCRNVFTVYVSIKKGVSKKGRGDYVCIQNLISLLSKFKGVALKYYTKKFCVCRILQSFSFSFCKARSFRLPHMLPY